MEQDSPLLKKYYDVDRLAADRAEKWAPAHSQVAEALAPLNDDRIWDPINDTSIAVDYPIQHEMHQAVSAHQSGDETHADLRLSQPYETCMRGDILIESRLLRLRYDVPREGHSYQEVAYYLVATHDEQTELVLEDIALGFVMPAHEQQQSAAFLQFAPVPETGGAVSLETHALRKDDRDDVVAEFTKAAQRLGLLAGNAQPIGATATEAAGRDLERPSLEPDVLIEELPELGVRAYTLLKRNEINTVGQLTASTRDLLWDTIRKSYGRSPHAEQKTAEEVYTIIQALETHGHELKIPESHSEPITVLLEDGEHMPKATSTRLANLLEDADIKTIGDLCAYSEEELASIPKLGLLSLNYLVEALHRRGLQLCPKTLRRVELASKKSASEPTVESATELETLS